MIGEQITTHDKIWINESGQEVYAPSSSNQEAFKTVKPLSESVIRPEGMPPKSWAEIYREKEALLRANIDDESKAALDLLRSKGIL
jgi:hypothetical protein